MRGLFRFTILTREDGGLRVSCDDEPGLILSGDDPEKVMASIWPALKALDHRRAEQQASRAWHEGEMKS